MLGLILKNWQTCVFAFLMAIIGVQSVRLAHAKSDLGHARVALIDPATKKTWSALASDRMAVITQVSADNNDLRSKIEAQNLAVQTSAALAQRKVAAAQAIALSAQQSARATQSKIDSLLKSHQAVSDKCLDLSAAYDEIRRADP